MEIIFIVAVLWAFALPNCTPLLRFYGVMRPPSERAVLCLRTFCGVLKMDYFSVIVICAVVL